MTAPARLQVSGLDRREARAQKRRPSLRSKMATDLERSFNPMSLAFVEGLYEEYLRDPASVPEKWREYFAGIPHNGGPPRAQRLGPTFTPSSIFNPAGNGRVHGPA